MTSFPVFQSIEAEKSIADVLGADVFAGRFSGLAPGDAIAKKNTIAIAAVSRAAKIPNAEQTFLKAAVEVVKAAPPNPSCSSPAGPGMGRPCVDPDPVGITRALCQIR